MRITDNTIEAEQIVNNLARSISPSVRRLPIYSLVLLAIYISVEKSIDALGGDWGGFLFVAAHFILLPLTAVAFIVFSAKRLPVPAGKTDLIVFSASIAIPIAIIYFAATGSPVPIVLMGINFNK